MVSAPVQMIRTARVLSRKRVGRARRVYVLLLHVLLHYVARCGWRREASDWPPGPGPYAGRTRALFTGGGLLFINAPACTHRRATTKRPFVLKQRARTRIYACVGIKRVVYYGSKWRA